MGGDFVVCFVSYTYAFAITIIITMIIIIKQKLPSAFIFIFIFSTCTYILQRFGTCRLTIFYFFYKLDFTQWSNRCKMLRLFFFCCSSFICLIFFVCFALYCVQLKPPSETIAMRWYAMWYMHTYTQPHVKYNFIYSETNLLTVCPSRTNKYWHAIIYLIAIYVRLWL